MAQNTASKQLFDLLISRDFDPELLDSMGKPANDPSEAEVFSFDFRAESGKDYGTVVIMLSDDGELDVFCADNVGRSMEGQDKTDWFNFLEQLKNFAVRNFMSFGIKNLNRLRYSMQGQASIKEGLFESWTGTKTTSWNGKPTEARLMIKHKRALGENDARFRYVESLFIETAEGERYKLPFTKLSGGRAMVEHVRQGGKPYDIRGQHITSVVEEINVLSRFRRANHGQIFEGDTAQLVEQTNAYYESLQKQLKGMSNKRGYSTYFESWNPTEISEEEVVIEGLKHLFITQNLDTRIEQALPLLARIQQEGNAMKEANIFEAWATRLMEGTWALPDTPEKQAKLVELLSDTLPVGADATNSTEQLYDLIGDDILFDQLHDLADQDANADCRQIIIDRLQQFQGDPDVAEVINRLNINDSEMTPPATVPVPDAGTDEDPTLPDVDKEKITRLAESGRIIEVNGRKVDVRSIEIDGVDTRDAPDFSDAYISYAQFDDGSELSDSDLDRLNDDHGDLVHELAYDSLHEEVKDPATQTEDPAGTKQPSFPEYDDSLSAILKSAGVGGQDNPAPDYEEEIAEADDEQLDEFLPALAAIGGRLAGGAVAGELGLGTVGTGLAKTAGSAIAQNLVTPDDEEVEESKVAESEIQLSRLKTLAGFLVR
jgi:hypothetical protein